MMDSSTVNYLPETEQQSHTFQRAIKKRSDYLINYFLIAYFLIGLFLATFYDTWLIAISVGGLCLLAYYSVKIALPDSSLYQYILSIILGIFMAQFIYQMHGMFEMHFFAFIGSAILVTYQKWKLQIPMLILVMVHHSVFSHLQDIGFSNIYFSQLGYFTLQTFIIHLLLVVVIFFICGLWAYQLNKYNEIQYRQAMQMAEMQKEAQLLTVIKNNAEILEERNTILESITDTFFAVDKNWIVTYWNNQAEKVLGKQKSEVLGQNIWELFPNSLNTTAYDNFKKAMETNKAVHFDDYYAPIDLWFEASAYPSMNGLSVYYKNITERKQSELRLKESEKRYSELFDLSPMPMWIFDAHSLQFLDVNKAAIKNYGYTIKQFLSMTIRDIRPEEDIQTLKNVIEKSKDLQNTVLPGIFKHRKKNGKIIQVDIQSNVIEYQGKKAKFILANDVTERLNYISAIEEQNNKLLEISWLQSHVVRAPLAKIMALIELLNLNDANDNELLLQYLLVSAHELDKVILSIMDQSELIQV